jgi:nucleoside-diphosphate-sugar epimerase
MVSALRAPAGLLDDDLGHVLAHTEDLWADLAQARLLVTGGTGFVGSWLLESLCAANQRLGLGAEAVVLTRDPEAFAHARPHLTSAPGITLLSGDARTFDSQGRSFSHVIHGATSADAVLNLERPLDMIDTIVRGTSNTLERAARAGATTVLLLSSGAVYGRQPPGLERIAEHFPGAPDQLEPRQAYAEGKRLAELLGAVYARDAGMEVKIARLFAFVGPYLPLDRHFAIGNFIRDRIAGGPIAISGDGAPHRSYLYAADLAIWLWTILLRGASARPYNVGSERAVSIAEVADIVARATRPAVVVTVATAPRADLPPERYVPDTTRARCELGLKERIELEDGVRRTLDWAQRQGLRR